MIYLILIISTLYFIIHLFDEDPKSTSKYFGDDSKEIEIPKKGLENKKIAVIGGGISGLSSAKYLLEANANVTLLEKEDRVGGNNDPYLENGKHYATTVIVTYPCQQPHYLNLCRELGINQIPHDFEELEGEIILKENKKLKVRMGSGFWTFFKYIYKQCSTKELIDGIHIMLLFYKQFKLRPESKKSIKDVLGKRLVKSSAFTHVFMPWIGINTWCRFDDIDSQPAHIFGAFIYEYALTLSIRKKDYLPKENGWCVLDGRIIHELEKKLKNNKNYIQRKKFNVTNITRQNNKIIVMSDENEKLEFDKIIVATQPFQALPIIKEVGTKKLIQELEKWPKMDCYVILHKDLSQIKDMPWVHQTHINQKNKNYYITNTIKPRMSKIKYDCAITFVYNKINYKDFIDNHIDVKKIIKTYTPKLPIFTLENSINRNEIWDIIDNDCHDVYWTQACKSGIQYHNNAILNSKKIVKIMAEKELSLT